MWFPKWTRLGFLVPIIFVVFLLLGQLSIDSYFGEDYYSGHDWPPLFGCSAAGLVIWQVGSFLDKRAKRERDLKNYEHTTQYDAHTFIYVKFHYWGLVAIGLGVFVYLTSVFDIFEGADSSQPKQQRSEQTSDGNP